MINKRELWVKMGSILSQKEFEEDIEKNILSAAKEGKRNIIYKFDRRSVDKYMIDELYITLNNAGYNTSYAFSESKDPYDEISISW